MIRILNFGEISKVSLKTETNLSNDFHPDPPVGGGRM
jgi:hypothetical protein